MTDDQGGTDTAALAAGKPSAAELGAMTLDEWRAYLVAEWTKRGKIDMPGVSDYPTTDA
jgi:hypothetical protein